MTVPGPRNVGRREDRGSGVQIRRPNARRFRYGGKALCALGACLLLVTLVGPSASASKKGLSGTLTMNVFTFTTPVMKPVIAAFEKANPGVHVSAANVVNTPSTYVPLLQTERLAGNLPMINETYDVLTPTLEVDGLTGDLTSGPQGRQAVSAELLAPDLRGVVHSAGRSAVRRRSRLRAGERG